VGFRIIWTGPNGMDGSNLATAADVIKKHQELRTGGYQKIVIKDDGGRTLKFQEVAVLAAMVNRRA
jgi:hypothetical protein